MKKTTLFALVTALTLGACSRGPEQQPLEDNVVEVENMTENANVAVAPPAVNATNVVAAPAAPAPGFTDDEQMRDDADATGMTARLPDDSAAPGQNGNETRPAD